MSAATSGHYRLPPFAELAPDTIRSQLKRVLGENRARLQELLARSGDDGGGNADWRQFFTPLEDMEQNLFRVLSPLGHLHSVRADEAELRKLYKEAIQQAALYDMELLHNRELCGRYRSHADSQAFADEPAERRAAVSHSLVAFRHAGVDLPPETREQLKRLEVELETLQASFEEQLLDATRAVKIAIEHEEQLSGLPPQVVAEAREAAAKAAQPGWLLELSQPLYVAVMTRAENRQLREDFYRAWCTRASTESEHPQFDNAPLIGRILELRARKAELIGCQNFAELVLEQRMAASAEEVETLLLDLARIAKESAATEFKQLSAFAAAELGIDELEHWDLAFASERLKKARFSYDEEAMRRHFPLDRVLAGLFEIIRRLFGVTAELRPGVAAWHEDVRSYVFSSAQGREIGMVMVDLFARSSKREGAWMDEGSIRRRAGERLELPIAYVVSSFERPAAGKSPLLRVEEVLTLMHEFGHALHHLLTEVETAAVSGIRGVEWDAVELPSQLLECWCRRLPALELLADSPEAAAELLPKIEAASTFQAGLTILRQLEFSLFDLRLHRAGADVEVRALLEGVREEISVFKPPAFNRFECGFSHIFAGGYAAGYYSYLWAEALAADAFEKLTAKEVFDAEAGERFRRAFLSRGGSRPAAEMYADFSGGPPDPRALLRRRGLAERPAAP